MTTELMSIDEIAKRFDVSRRTVERWTRDGRLAFPEPAATIGRVRGWRERDVERWATRTLPRPTGRPPKGSRSKNLAAGGRRPRS